MKTKLQQPSHKTAAIIKKHAMVEATISTKETMVHATKTVTLLCLHGWGGSKESFTELRNALKDSPITILTPDLPGFGAEPEPSRPWTNDDYADWVLDWFKANSPIPAPQSLFLLGHSHGGRIAIKLTAGNRLPVDHLFLCASAGIRRPRHINRIIGLTLAKSGKGFLSIPGMRSLQPLGKKLLYKLVRVHDYEKASPIMRDTLINVTEEDLRPLLSCIEVPTDLFWGTEDRMTPIADGRLITRKIVGSVLHEYPGVRHGVHRDKAAEIASVMTGINL
jgi:pimeloyl-ACP methyl ester carboxylesterase